MEESKKLIAENSDGDKDAGKKSRGPLIMNILTGVILAIALVFLIQAFYTNKNLHNNYFGYAVLPVASESMNVGKDSIKKGDVAFVKLLKGKDKAKLKPGDIVTFKHPILELGTEELITHRILIVHSWGYTTHGDANPKDSTEDIQFDKVVGVYKGKIGGIGHVGLFFETKAGSFIMIVVPFILMLLLSGFHFVRSMRAYNKEKVEGVAEAARMSVSEEEKERIRQEILREMEREKMEKAKGESDKE